MKQLFYKALAYRLTATAITAVASLIVTGSITVSLVIASVEFFLKIIGYMLFELLWRKFKE